MTQYPVDTIVKIFVTLRLGSGMSLLRLRYVANLNLTCRLSDIHGSGEGRGGGSGGSVRSTGGAFGQKEAAVENQFFVNKTNEDLVNLREKLKNSHQNNQEYHKNEIKHHKEAMKHHEEALKKLKGENN